MRETRESTKIPLIVAFSLTGVLALYLIVAMLLQRPSVTTPPEFGLPVGRTDLPEGWGLCTNAVRRYRIGYPKQWFTAQNSDEDACRWFNPQPFQVVAQNDGPATALEAYPDSVSFEEAIRGMTNPAVARTLRRGVTTVRGRRALRLEVEATGIGPMPKGTRIFAYLVDFGERGIFVVETTALAPGDYAANKAVVEQAAQTLRWF